MNSMFQMIQILKGKLLNKSSTTCFKSIQVSEQPSNDDNTSDDRISRNRSVMYETHISLGLTIKTLFFVYLLSYFYYACVCYEFSFRKTCISQQLR